LNGIKNTVIENVEIGPCGEHGISITDSQDVLIRNVTIHDTEGTGIRILGSQSITVAESNLTNTLSGISVQSSRQIRIGCNRFRDVRGPIPSGQCPNPRSWSGAI
jgi:nitrous oxidase accessory protein NosD